MKRSITISAAGIVVLFIAFLLLQTPVISVLGTIKLTDILILIGGLLFVIPIYMNSVRRKTAQNAPNQTLWKILPPIGMAIVCIGVLLPNSLLIIGAINLPDIFYLIGCLMMLPIVLYPTFDPRETSIEDTVEEEIEDR
jgi:hypothetical protein